MTSAAPQFLAINGLAPLSLQTPADTVAGVHVPAYAVPLAYHALPASYAYPPSNIVIIFYYKNNNKIIFFDLISILYFRFYIRRIDTMKILFYLFK